MLALTPLCNQPPLGGLSELCVVVVSKAPFHFRAATHCVGLCSRRLVETRDERLAGVHLRPLSSLCTQLPRLSIIFVLGMCIFSVWPSAGRTRLLCRACPERKR